MVIITSRMYIACEILFLNVFSLKIVKKEKEKKKKTYTEILFAQSTLMTGLH